MRGTSSIERSSTVSDRSPPFRRGVNQETSWKSRGNHKGGLHVNMMSYSSKERSLWVESSKEQSRFGFFLAAGFVLSIVSRLWV